MSIFTLSLAPLKHGIHFIRAGVIRLVATQRALWVLIERLLLTILRLLVEIIGLLVRFCIKSLISLSNVNHIVDVIILLLIKRCIAPPSVGKSLRSLVVGRGGTLRAAASKAAYHIFCSCTQLTMLLAPLVLEVDLVFLIMDFILHFLVVLRFSFYAVILFLAVFL